MNHILIVGSGHAGIEAAHFANKLGNKTTLVTYSKNDIGKLHCNVSIGGSAKGIVVKELFALGGIMPMAADATQVQTKILNSSKGPAVQSLRAQVDKLEYPRWMTNYIENSSINLVEGEVHSLYIVDNKAQGVVLANGEIIEADAVILATGTFLNSKTMKGKEIIIEGPDGSKTTKSISDQLRDYDIELIRLKTGTPPRIKQSSINFDILKEEPGSDEPIWFTEDDPKEKEYENIPAWIAYTNEKTHEIISNNFDKSYLFSEEMVGSGPRYCPSIEDKVKRFADKERHQIFLEIESKEMDTIYLSGLSSSLPRDIQEEVVRSMKGFENAVFDKYAYAIEYDSVNPTQLKQTLELKAIENLFMAGQINGTSGYEEAAAQGMIAGVNASNKLNGIDDFILDRNEAYIGVMIDDITSKGVQDPYRLLTSRAEYRLLLRNDNAVKRLYEKSYKSNLINKEKYEELKNKFELFDKFDDIFWKTRLNISDDRFAKLLSAKNIELKVNSIPAINIIKRPEFNILELEDMLREQISELKNFTKNDLVTLAIEKKFAGYIAKQEREVADYQRYQKLELPIDIDYNKIPNLALEAKEKLNNFKPRTVHQARFIQGINPSDIMNLVAFLNKNK